MSETNGDPIYEISEAQRRVLRLPESQTVFQGGMLVGLMFRAEMSRNEYSGKAFSASGNEKFALRLDASFARSVITGAMKAMIDSASPNFVDSLRQRADAYRNAGWVNEGLQTPQLYTELADFTEGTANALEYAMKHEYVGESTSHTIPQRSINGLTELA